MSKFLTEMLKIKGSVCLEADFLGSGAPADLKVMKILDDPQGERMGLDISLSYPVSLSTGMVLRRGNAPQEDRGIVWEYEKLPAKTWFSYSYLESVFGDGIIDRLRLAQANFEAIEADKDRSLTKRDILWFEPGPNGIAFNLVALSKGKYCLQKMAFSAGTLLKGFGSGTSFCSEEPTEDFSQKFNLGGLIDGDSATAPAGVETPRRGTK